MINENKVYRYLKLRSRRNGFIRGTTVCRHLNIRFKDLKKLDDINGIGSIGVAAYEMKTREARRYAKRNAYCADFRGMFRLNDRIYCIKQKKIRKGKNPINFHLLK